MSTKGDSITDKIEPHAQRVIDDAVQALESALEASDSSFKASLALDFAAMQNLGVSSFETAQHIRETHLKIVRHAVRACVTRAVFHMQEGVVFPRPPPNLDPT